MKNIFLIFYISILQFSSIYSQIPTCEWARGSVGTSDVNQGRKIKVGMSGNVFVLGSFSDDSIDFGGMTVYKDGYGQTGGINNFFVLKYDLNGNLIFAKTLASGDFDAFGFDLDANDNFYVVGSFYRDSALIGSTPVFNNSCEYCNKMFIAKFDSAGNSVWLKANSSDGIYYGRGGSIDAFGNIYTIAFCSSTDSVTFDSTSITVIENDVHVIVAKFDSDGNTKWIKASSGHGDNKGIDIANDPIGNVFITGSFTATALSFDSIIIYNNHPPGWWNDIFVAKYDSSGIALWAKSEGGLNQNGDQPFCISTSASGEVYVGGYYSPNTTFDTIVLPGQGAFLAALGPNGDINWIKTINGDLSADASGVDVDASGNIYLTGDFGGDSVLVDSIVLYNNPSLYMNFPECLYLVKYDHHGIVKWAKKGIGLGSGNAICTDNFENVYLTGLFGRDTLILSPQILTVSNTYYTTFAAKFSTTNGIREDNIEESDVIILPNPATSSFTIHTSFPIQNEEIEIYNLLGKKVVSKQWVTGKNEITIDVSVLNPGLYFVKVQTEKGSSVQKLLIQ